jgi:hypothetical protein
MQLISLEIEKRIVQKWAVRSSRVGLTNDSPGFFLLLSDFSFFLSPFVRSFVRSATVAPLSRNTHTHLDVDTHTHTRIIRWQVLTVRPFSSGLDVLTCTSRFFVCRECALSCVCVVCVCVPPLEDYDQRFHTVYDYVRRPSSWRVYYIRLCVCVFRPFILLTIALRCIISRASPGAWSSVRLMSSAWHQCPQSRPLYSPDI